MLKLLKINKYAEKYLLFQLHIKKHILIESVFLYSFKGFEFTTLVITNNGVVYIVLVRKCFVS